MPQRHLARWLGSLAIAGLLLAPGARAELAAWDQAKVIRLATELATATDALYETYMHQPPPNPGSAQSESYHGLRHLVRNIRGEARMLKKSLEEGDGREHTAWIYEILTSYTRSARYEARSNEFVSKDVGERAAGVRAVLNQLGPYYDRDFRTLAPDSAVEPGATR